MTEDTRAHDAPNRDPDLTEIRGRVLDQLIDDIRTGLATSIYLAEGRLPISDPVGAALMLGVIDKLDALLAFHRRVEHQAAVRRAKAEAFSDARAVMGDDFESRVRANMVFDTRPPAINRETAAPLPKCDFCGTRDPICPLAGPPPECKRTVEVEITGGGGGGAWMGAMAAAVKESPQEPHNRRGARERRATLDVDTWTGPERRVGQRRDSTGENL